MASAWSGNGPIAPSRESSVAERQERKSQTRQLLSCTKCRERKFKCDRTKPCSSCCARGNPKDCVFVVGEGNDYSPIQQSYEIRKLRQENTRLKERLQAAKLSHSGEDEDDTESNDRRGPSGVSRAAAAHQRRFRTRERVDNLYFGTPGLANIVTDFANLQVELQAGGASLTHNMPRAQDMYAVPGSAYPFPILWQSSNNNASALVSCFPQQDEEIFSILESFQRRGQSCSFPHTPDVVTRKEVERFLTDRDGNAETFPDMLALIFATMATGLQMGQYDRSGGKWDADAVEQTRRQSDVYCE